MVAATSRHRVVLAVAFSISLVVSSTVGPAPAYRTQPLVQQVLLVFLLPITAAVVYWIFQDLQRRQLLIADALTPDPAVQSIIFWILAFLLGVHVMVLMVVVGVESVQA